MIDDFHDHIAPGPAATTLPRVNGAVRETTIKSRNKSNYGRLRVPMHVLFNQAGRICSRRNAEIKGTKVQQSFVQRLVSTTTGRSIPLLSFLGSLFTRHYYASAGNDPTAILGCQPICALSKPTNFHGMASNLQQSRVYITHASSSTATDDHHTACMYDIQANRASVGIDSRLATRSGFRVSTTSSSGLELGEGSPSELSETLDSAQGTMNLAAAAVKLGMDLFLTYTCNQSTHPGICHLHKWKESKGWTAAIDGYDTLPLSQKEDYNISMEMAYSNILTRCWLEVRKLWIQFIIYSTTTILGRVAHAFFRDEYQESSGNLSHIHGLLGLHRGEMDKKEFREFVCSLQRNSVCDLVSTSEINDFIAEGLFRDERDWITCKGTAEKVLSHKCTNRCLMRIDHTGDFEKDYVCRKIHPVKHSKNCHEDEFQPLPYKFSDACLEILQGAGLWDPPSPGRPLGTFKHHILQPSRHVGVCHPGATENMSPVNNQHFAFTKSMQNIQVITDTNGVSRYVVKVSYFQ